MLQSRNTFSSLEPSQRELILAHLDAVIKLNHNLNLTRITGEEEAFLLHVEDSLVGLSELNEAPEGLYADLGSGAGFPGIPLAIASQRKTVLVESRGKKATALSSIIANLGISVFLTVYKGRIEELALDKPNEFSVLTARALSSVSSLLELASPLLKKGGHLLCYKGRSAGKEVIAAQTICEKLGMGFLSDRKVILSDGKTERRIIRYEKTAESSVKLPRRPGMAQKRPYLR